MDIGALGVYACLFLALYFEVFLLISFIEQRPAKKDTRLPKRYPSVSIIVPVWNEERTLAATMGSLLALEYPKDKLELMIVDDGSTDNTRSIGERFAKESAQVTYVYKENGGKYTALNYGIKTSQADLVGCLDADSFVSGDALLEVVKKFEEDTAIMALMPAMRVYRPRTMLELMQAAEYTFGIFYRKMIDNLSALHVLPGPFSFYRREIFTKIGYFRHAHNTEDMEIAFRMHAHGYKIANVHTAFVHTTVPKTVRALLKQRIRWSQGFLQNSIDYAYMYFNPKYGNFGMLTLPFGLMAFFSGIYIAAYTVYRLLFMVSTRIFDGAATGVPLQLPTLGMPSFEWFYINTSMLTFLILTSFVFMVFAMLMGRRIGDTKLSFMAFVSYFMLFGFIAPLWLARAAWGTMRAEAAPWR